MQTVLLVDSNNIARRNYHGQNLVTTSGIKTGLIYGYINSIIMLKGLTKADIIVHVWDGVGSSAFRKAICPMYKGNRTAPEPDYIEGKERLQQLLEALGSRQLTTSGCEADDAIAYLAVETFKDSKVYIASNDKDYYQIVDDRINIVMPDKGVITPAEDGKITLKHAGKEIRLKPSQVLDFKILSGDTADNMPGAPGFGIGAAIKFFAKNESVDDLITGKAIVSDQTTKATQGLIAILPLIKQFKFVLAINLKEGKCDLPDKTEPNKTVTEALFGLYEFNQFKSYGDSMYNLGGK